MKKRIAKISFLAIPFLLVCTISSAQQNKPTGDKQVPAATMAATNIHTGSVYTGTTINYVRAWQPNKPLQSETDVTSETDVSRVGHTTQYFDGLGRPLQTVGWQAAPGKGDMVAPVEYDEFGREVYKYLPYVSANNTGDFKTDPFTQQSSFYTSTYPGEQKAITGEQVFYSKTNYEASPLNRAEKTFAPGNSWAGSEGSASEHAALMQYLVNEASDDVKVWDIGFDPFTYPTLNEHQSENIPTTSLPYDAGQLYKTLTIDEAGNAVVEYKDKEGHIVLKKVQAGAVTAADPYTNWLCTYYVYDNQGQLRFVIPPKAVKEMAKTSNWTLINDMINELCFRYEYDSRQRMIAKKVPGSAWVYLIYDRRDRLVMMQDGNMRTKKHWLYTLYDAFNRPVQTGMITDNTHTDPLTMQGAVDDAINNPSGNGSVTTTGDLTGGGTTSSIPADKIVSQWEPLYPDQQATNTITFNDGYQSTDAYAGDHFTAEIVAGGTTGGTSNFSNNTAITDNPVPQADQASMVALTLTYYDGYKDDANQALSSKSFDNSIGGTLAGVIGASPVNVYPEATPSFATAMTTGLATCTRVRVMQNPDNLSQGKWLETVSFYDDKGRVVQANSDNYAGGSDVASNLYDFTGKTVSSYTTHTQAANDNTPIHTLTWMTFDENGRVIETHKRINGDPNSDRTLSVNHYDRMGQLMTKNIGQKRDENNDYLLAAVPASLEKQQYSYNIRGWLKGINWNYASTSGTETTPQQDMAADKWFSMDLSYDWGYGTNQYNGNISGMRWQSAGDRRERSFGYGYDMASRFLFGDFKQQFGSDASGWANIDPADANYKIDFTTILGDGIGNGVSPDPDKEPYDANGNIRHMQQKGLYFTTTGATSDWVDKLSYRYTRPAPGEMTNKLSSVKDDITADYKLGDFNDHSNTTDDDYVTIDSGYDDNGNLTLDKNKHIRSIAYNHLNLPWIITVENSPTAGDIKGTITYLYDAGGNKIQKITDEKANATLNGNTEKITTTTYNGALQYEQVTITVNNGAPNIGTNALQFINTEEGRVRILANAPLADDASSLYAYDYFLKDHLGNVRMTLTDEYKLENFPYVTFEDANLSNESVIFDNVDKGRVDRPNDFYDAQTDGAKVQLLRKSTTDPSASMGAGKLLRVMAGDQINAQVNYYTPSGTADNQDANGATTLLTALSGLLDGAASPLPIKGAGGAVTSSMGTNSSFLSFIQPEKPGDGDTKVKAYLNVVFFDEQFRFVQQGSTAVQVSITGTGANLKLLQPAKAQKNGYVYVYLSNESNNFVYFDKLQVLDQHGPLTEETHYYPFGLSMSGIGSKALGVGGSENKMLYNKGSELEQNEFSDGSGLELYDTYFRQLDPQLGKWIQVDPKIENGQESLSPYMSMGNDPIRYNDPKGDIFGIDNLIGAVVGAAIDYGSQVIVNYASGKSVSQSLTQVDGKSIAISAGVGLLTSGVANVAGKFIGKAVTKIAAGAVSKAAVIAEVATEKAVAKLGGEVAETTTLKALQAVVRQSQPEMNAFFKSGGETAVSKQALLDYKNLITKILGSSNAAITKKATVTAVAEQTKRLQLIVAALKNLK